jgi:CheY-like chemotaxis protein
MPSVVIDHGPGRIQTHLCDLSPIPSARRILPCGKRWAVATPPNSQGRCGISIVVIVEDDLQLASMLEECIRDWGHEVFEAGNGDEAVSLLSSSTVPVDIVFTGVLMPGSMDGYGLARWLQRHHPAIRILLTSGHAPEPSPDEDELLSTALLLKPYSLDEPETRLHQARVNGPRLNRPATHRFPNIAIARRIHCLSSTCQSSDFTSKITID